MSDTLYNIGMSVVAPAPVVNEIDWKKLSPREIRHAERTMPRVAAPWKLQPHKRYRVAGRGLGERCVGEVLYLKDRGYFFIVDDGAPENGFAEDCESFEDGVQKVDARLRKGGWLLDDEVGE
jgi:hypothetical protein